MCMKRKGHAANQEGLNWSRTSRWSCGPVWSPGRMVQCQPDDWRESSKTHYRAAAELQLGHVQTATPQSHQDILLHRDQVNSARTSSSDHAYWMPKGKSMCPDGHIWLATFSDEGEKDIQGWSSARNIMAGSFQLPPLSEGNERLRQGGTGQEIISL